MNAFAIISQTLNFVYLVYFVVEIRLH